MKEYNKPRAYKTKYAIHGPTKNNKYFLIPKGMLGDPEPNCRTIPAEHFRCPTCLPTSWTLSKHSLSP